MDKQIRKDLLARFEMSSYLHHYICYCCGSEIEFDNLPNHSGEDGHNALLFLAYMENLTVSVEMAIKALLVVNGLDPRDNTHNLSELFAEIHKIDKGATQKKIAEKVGPRLKSTSSGSIGEASVKEIAKELGECGNAYVDIKYMGMLKGGRISKTKWFSGVTMSVLEGLYNVIDKMARTKSERIGVPTPEEFLRNYRPLVPRVSREDVRKMTPLEEKARMDRAANGPNRKDQQ